MTELIRLPVHAVAELRFQADEYCEIRKKIIDSGLTEDLAAIELDELGSFWRWLKEELSSGEEEQPTLGNVIYMDKYRKYADVAATPETIGVTDSSYEEIEAGNYLIGNPQNTYILDVVGNSMIDEGIYNGTILVVEEYRDSHTDLLGGEMVVVSLGGSFSMMVKVYHKDEEGHIYLISANSQYPPIPVKGKHEHLLIQGIVRKVLNINSVGLMSLAKRNQYLQLSNELGKIESPL